jgi:hypothetical protein
MHKPDPIAADILRKEPEQEQFVRLIVSPTGRPLHFLFVLSVELICLTPKIPCAFSDKTLLFLT